MWGIGTTLAVAVPVLAAAGLALALHRARRLHRAVLEERGWLLERERASAAESAVRAERTRIAAELHDIVSHNVSVMVVQAGAAREVLATLPDEAAAAMAAVEAAGRDAMTELRQLLGLLAPPADGSEPGPDPLAPQPGLNRLGSLVDRISFAGLPVEVRISGEPRPLPGGIDVTAYRIVQEALTNALKHGDGSGADVTIRYTGRALRVEVLNGGPSVLTGAAPLPHARTTTTASAAEGAGHGLAALRERVAVHGGDLDARRRLGGGYRVRARIPLDRP
ncbi:sensor histidine kinase [Kitasatospora sp. NPDC096147]|uniref:sensor histidine kinase n=1 Tax=Kitasatospora sp. NPDC096147 TaxID=3364093 RepID=UPI00381EC4CB